jgi:hypothetical protein
MQKSYLIAATLLVLFFQASFFSNNIQAERRITYDKDELPLWRYFEGDTLHDSIEYFCQDHSLKTVRFGMQYTYGVDSLRQQMINYFHESIDNSCETMHIRIFYCILFDEKLHIKEIRFQRIGLVGRFIEQLDCCGYFFTLEYFIKQTEGKWNRDKRLEQGKHGSVFFNWVEI